MGFNLWLYGILLTIGVLVIVAGLTDNAVLTVLAGVGTIIAYYLIVKFLLGLADKGGQALQRKFDEKLDEKYKNRGGR